MSGLSQQQRVRLNVKLMEAAATKLGLVATQAKIEPLVLDCAQELVSQLRITKVHRTLTVHYVRYSLTRRAENCFKPPVSIQESSDYRFILKEELDQRCQKNPRYSLRSFARDLGLSPSRLSDVLRGRYGISREAALKITKRLAWTEIDRLRFCDLVESEHGRNLKKKLAAKSRLEKPIPQHQQLSIDAFSVIADWHHYALLELTLVKGFKSEITWIAKRLGISTHSVKSALARLKRLELIEEHNGVLRASDGFTASPSGIPSEALRKFHRQILAKAEASLQLQSLEERDISAMVLAFDQSQMQEAKAMIKKFRRDFDQKFAKSQNRNVVYCLSTQFFRIQESIATELI